jgi:hypothetical protein
MITRHPSVDAVVWVMPLVNFKGFRDAYVAPDGALPPIVSKKARWSCLHICRLPCVCLITINPMRVVFL